MLKGASLGVVSSPLLLGGCGAPAAVPAAQAAAPAASAFAGWYMSLTSSVAATLIADSFKELFAAGWELWREPTGSSSRSRMEIS